MQLCLVIAIPIVDFTQESFGITSRLPPRRLLYLEGIRLKSRHMRHQKYDLLHLTESDRHFTVVDHQRQV
jgi:hypothetical protein